MNLRHSRQIEINRLQWAGQALGSLSVLQDLEAVEVTVPIRESCPPLNSLCLTARMSWKCCWLFHDLTTLEAGWVGQ